MSERFRVTINRDGDVWEAVIYDLADHGPDLPYAGCASPDIREVMREASHYVAVAALDTTEAMEW